MSIGGKNINFNNLTQENNVEHNWLLTDKYKIHAINWKHKK